ncbi:hypothetical protein PoB_004416100 [Plakobranchus ocellatus]|uniref:DDE Tnp4 domain-containing protein n=1 Tax=Plakobranchus ocellatus TaxID=259542 RepID=A0AAV4BFR4_9GAST|nr:hypothetical protein PoB_004416100 [Plakobranchus ocellatus]
MGLRENLSFNLRQYLATSVRQGGTDSHCLVKLFTLASMDSTFEMLISHTRSGHKIFGISMNWRQYSLYFHGKSPLSVACRPTEAYSKGSAPYLVSFKARDSWKILFLHGDINVAILARGATDVVDADDDTGGVGDEGADVNFDVGDFGRHSDGGVLKHSFGRALYSNSSSIRPDESIRGSDPLPNVFQGNKAYPLLRNVMRPFPSRGLDDVRRIFSNRHSRTRRTIECAFGALAGRWSFLKTP